VLALLFGARISRTAFLCLQTGGFGEYPGVIVQLQLWTLAPLLLGKISIDFVSLRTLRSLVQSDQKQQPCTAEALHRITVLLGVETALTLLSLVSAALDAIGFQGPYPLLTDWVLVAWFISAVFEQKQVYRDIFQSHQARTARASIGTRRASMPARVASLELLPRFSFTEI
jgi:hypothetical protein